MAAITATRRVGVVTAVSPLGRRCSNANRAAPIATANRTMDASSPRRRIRVHLADFWLDPRAPSDRDLDRQRREGAHEHARHVLDLSCGAPELARVREQRLEYHP